MHPGDEEIVSILRSSQKIVYYIVNKCDGEEQNLKVIDFYALGVDRLVDISALYGRSVNNLVEEALGNIDNYEEDADKDFIDATIDGVIKNVKEN